MSFNPASLGLGQKIGWSLALFVLPMGLILYLLVAAQNRDIGFASREVHGVRALSALNELQAVAERALFVGDRAEQAVRTIDGAAVDFAALDLADEAAAIVRALRDAGDAATVVKARAALRGLQVKVGERGNLVFDGILQTCYLTDVVLNRLPNLLDRLADMAGLAAAQADAADARARFLIALGGLDVWLDGLDASMHAAADSDTSGMLKSGLMRDYGSLHKDLSALRDRLRTSAAMRAGQPHCSTEAPRFCAAPRIRWPPR